MNTVLHKQQKRQQLNQTNQTISDCSVLEQYLKDCGKIKLAILNTAYYMADNWRFCAPSHSLIAKKAHASVDYTQEVLSWAKRVGLIDYVRRFNNTNVYSLPEALKQPSIKERLLKYLPCLRGYLCLSMLLSTVTLTKTQESHPISIIPEVTASIFDSQSNDLVEKPGIKEDINEDLTISYINNRESIYRRQAIVELISQQRITTRFLYPHLCDSMRFLAIQMSLTPYKSCYLAFIPEQIANEALQFYQYTAMKNQIPKNKAKFIGSLLKDLLVKNEMSFDYSFINTLSSEFGMDIGWTTMTIREKIVLEQAISYIGRRVGVKQELQREQCKPVSKGPSQSAIQADKERIARLRNNPYSSYYTGPVSQTTTVSPVVRPTSKGNYEANNTFKLNNTNAPQNPPVAPAPPKGLPMSQAQKDLARQWGIIID